MSGLSGVAPSMNAGELVNDAWTSWKSEARSLAERSEYFLADLSNINVGTISTQDINFHVPDLSYATAVIGAAPTADALQFTEYNIPNAPETSITLPDISDAPVNTAIEPITSFTSPAPFNATAPDADVTINYPDTVTAPTLVYPTEPGDTTGSAPGLPSFIVPSFTDLDLPTWSAVAPVNNLSVPPVSINYSQSEYSGTEVQTWIEEMMDGTIPDNIWNAIITKARSQFDSEELRGVSSTMVDWSSRGFDMPSGLVDRTVQEVREKAALAKGEQIQAILTEQAKSDLDNTQKAIQNGVSLEGQLIQLYNESENRLVRVQELSLNYATTLFGLQVNLFNASLDAYKTEASVFSDRVKAVLANVEVYKAKVDAEKLKLESGKIAADIYETEVRAYGERVKAYKTAMDALDAQVGIYRERVNARKVDIEAERLKLGVAENKIKLYSAEVDAYQAQTQGVATTNDINKVKADVYNSAISSYSTRVQAYKAATDAKIAVAAQANTVNDYATKSYAAQMDGIRSLVNQEMNRIQSLITYYDAQARVYKANAEIVQGESSTAISAWQASASISAEQAKVAAEKAKVDIEQILRIAEMESANAKTAATVYGQVGAATLAGVSMSAGLSERADWSNDYNVSHNYKYDCETGQCR